MQNISNRLNFVFVFFCRHINLITFSHSNDKFAWMVCVKEGKCFVSRLKRKIHSDWNSHLPCPLSEFPSISLMQILSARSLFFRVNVTRVIMPISRNLMPAKRLNWAFEYEMIQSWCQFRSWDSKCIPFAATGNSNVNDTKIEVWAEWQEKKKSDSSE